MISPRDHAEGILLPVRAQPNARRAGIQGERDGALEVAVHAPPEDGRANEALVALLREQFALKRSQVELVAGLTGRDKQVLLRGVTRQQVAELLRRWLEG